MREFRILRWLKLLRLVEALITAGSDAAVTNVVEAEYVFGVRTFHLSCRLCCCSCAQ